MHYAIHSLKNYRRTNGSVMSETISNSNLHLEAAAANDRTVYQDEIWLDLVIVN